MYSRIKNKLCLLGLVCTFGFAQNAARTAEPVAGSGRVPDFALARLTLGQAGPFLDKAAGFANQVSPNSGPIAKMALANVLFKVPFDQALKFDGPAVIYILEPLNPGPNQETASILSVADAAALKKNLASVYGDAEEKSGALLYTIPQPLPQPDKILYLKIVGNQALLAPSAEILLKLENAAKFTPQTGEFAELEVSIGALKRLAGPQIEASLTAGALLAADDAENQKRVTAQLQMLQKMLWQIDTLNARAEFDAGSKNASLQLYIVPHAGSELLPMLATPLATAGAGQLAVLPLNAPLLLALGGDMHDWLDLLSKLQQGQKPESSRAVAELLGGGTSFSLQVAPLVFLAATADPDGSKGVKAAAFYQQLLNAFVQQINSSGTPLKPFGVASEKSAYRGADIVLQKPQPKEGGVENFAAGMPLQAQASVGGVLLLSGGDDPVAPVKAGLERAQQRTPLPPELAAIFSAPAPGTLAIVSVRAIELAGLAVKNLMPPQTTLDEIIGGLDDPPISAAYFIHDGQAGLRATLPGATAGSFLRLYFRLKRANIDVLELANQLIQASASSVPAPKSANDSVAPPPPVP